MLKFLCATAAAIAATVAVPSTASAQWYPRGYGISPERAVHRCANSVERRLSYRRDARVLDITQVRPHGSHIRVRGIAASGTRYGYGRAYRSNVWFTCDVDSRGHVGNLTFNR